MNKIFQGVDIVTAVSSLLKENFPVYLKRHELTIKVVVAMSKMYPIILES